MLTLEEMRLDLVTVHIKSDELPALHKLPIRLCKSYISSGPTLRVAVRQRQAVPATTPCMQHLQWLQKHWNQHFKEIQCNCRTCYGKLPEHSKPWAASPKEKTQRDDLLSSRDFVILLNIFGIPMMFCFVNKLQLEMFTVINI